MYLSFDGLRTNGFIPLTLALSHAGEREVVGYERRFCAGWTNMEISVIYFSLTDARTHSVLYVCGVVPFC